MSDYGGYKAILQQAAADAETDRKTPRVACPLCGEILQVNNRGVKNCPLGHWRSNN